MLGTVACFVLLELVRVNFPYCLFAVLLSATGRCMASLDGPNRTGMMSCLSGQHRRTRSGIETTLQNSAQVLSIGTFFSPIIVGITESLPQNLLHGLSSCGVLSCLADRVSRLSPVSTLLAAFLGYLQIEPQVGHDVLAQLPPDQQAPLTGLSFFL